MNEDELLYLLKHGRADEVRFIFKDLRAKSYPEEFPVFIDTMIKEYKVKRKNIAIRSGMSQDYTYKLLRGDKKTTERDYILAICIAIGMNLAQVQHALRIYGMPVLSNTDLRSHIIALGISEGKDIDEIDNWLEKSGFYLIKTSPDMPTAPILAVGAESAGQKEKESIESLDQSASNKTSSIESTDEISEYEEVDREINAERCGNAPMDYMYWGEIKIQNEEGSVYYVRAAYYPDGEQMDVMTEEMHDKIIQAEAVGQYHEDIEFLEMYESLADAAVSRFFKWFLELDRATDQKVSEILRQVDDTRSYGARYGAKINKGSTTYYMEAFNTQHPERREYFQIVENNNGRRFTASHESYYMWLELGEIYPAYFGKKMQEPEYFIDVRDVNELDGRNLQYRMFFKDLLTGMHQYAHRFYGAEISEDEMEREMIDALTQRAVAYYHSDKTHEAIKALEEAYTLLGKQPLQESLPARVVTCSKLADHYGDLGDSEQCEKWYCECYSYRDLLMTELQNPDSSEKLQDAPICVAYACIHFYNRVWNNDREKGLEYLKEAIDLFDGRCNNLPSWGSFVNCLMSYAFQIDGEDAEKSLEYSGRALDIIRDQGLDRLPPYHYISYLALNNHAWVLWNRLASEEAVIYYGRAIDLVEGYLATGTPDPEKMRDALEHEGYELYKIYKATGKNREADRLTARMRRAGIDLNED